MADEEHVAILEQGVDTWNTWRAKNADLIPDLRHADLWGANLREADLRNAQLDFADLHGAYLQKADMRWANLPGADLHGAYLDQADLTEADLEEADLSQAYLRGADLPRVRLLDADLRSADLRDTDLHEAHLDGVYLNGARMTNANLRNVHLSGAHLSRLDLSGLDLHKAYLSGADLSGVQAQGADLTEADLTEADLRGANLRKADLQAAKLNGAILSGTDLQHANLRGAQLREASLNGTWLNNAILTDCEVYGVSVWDVHLEGATQVNLAINAPGDPLITVDNLEVAQFLYLLLHNSKIRQIIDTLTSKVVLILGRFTAERKAVLEALRKALRQRNYVPVLFDFEGPGSRDFTETITLLARMARFIIADLTEPASIPQELQAIVPDVAVPVQPLIAEDAKPFAMFIDHHKYHWMLPTYQYADLEELLAVVQEQVIAPAEAKALQLHRHRRIGRAAKTKIGKQPKTPKSASNNDTSN
ncbi:MAG: pentapeptide repeat-containing protein [Ktedonobacterales bacterium]